MSKFNFPTLSKMKGEMIDVTLTGTDHNFEAELTDVFEARINGERWESFIVTMAISNALDVPLEQGHYHIEHENFGELTLFSSPNSPTELEFVICRDRIPS